MDLKPTKYKKGDMVRYYRMTNLTLGIVKGQDGGKVEVEWVLCPWSQRPRAAWYPLYKVKRVSQD